MSHSIRSLEELAVAGQTVFLRADLNVPLDAESRITDATRIEATLATIRYLIEHDAKLIIASHLGRPKGEINQRYSLLPVAEWLSHHLKQDVIFPETATGDAVSKLASELRNGDVMLLENLRFHPGEEANDADFAEQLTALATIYVTEAFGTLHRRHASTFGMVSHFKERGVGFLVQKELEVLTQLLETPKRPFWAILGGAKVADKIGLIEKLLDRVDGLALGGGLAFSFLKVMGAKIGNSLVDDSKKHVVHRILEKADSKGVKLLLPVDHRVSAEVPPLDEGTITTGVDVPSEQIGLDIGPQTITMYRELLAGAETIFWNGPLGLFENKAFAVGTEEIAKAVAVSEAFSVIGGGDSAAALKGAGLQDQVGHISTGGGASLTFLEGNELPGLTVLR